MDIEDDGFSVSIIETNQLQDKTPQGIRLCLSEALSRGLVGALFIGNIPVAWYELGGKKFPTDMYYRDLNGYWKDDDGDGVYNEHEGDVSPEIWIGWLKPSALGIGEEARLLNNYFDRNHQYRHGLRVLPWWRTLAYIDDDGIGWTEEANVSLSEVSTDITIEADSTVTTAEDFKTRLKDTFGFQWLYLMAHGSFDYNVFEVNGKPTGGTVYSWEYRNIDPRILLYLFFTCSAARYTEQDYLAGSAVFTTNYGLLAIGCTDDMFSISFRRFFNMLSKGDFIGNALQEWLQEQPKELNPFIFYGLTIIGDPILRPCIKQDLKIHDISIAMIKLCFQGSKNEENLLITAKIENRGNFTEYFAFTIRSFSFTLTILPLSLEPREFTIVNYTVTKPYSVANVSSVKTMLTISVEGVQEEFNPGDNLKRINLENVAIVIPEPRYALHPLESLISFFLIVIVAVYFFFRLIVSENSFMFKKSRFKANSVNFRRKYTIFKISYEFNYTFASSSKIG
ncbi:MAG: hypothetical protein QXR76_05670 [Candidatus Bathyarchaeia archaeon]